MEVMAVMAVIGIMAAIAAPRVGEAIADHRAAEVQIDMLRLVRMARARAAGYGRAHVLHVDTVANRVELWSGPSNRCTSVRWDQVSLGGCVDGNVWCVDQLRVDQVVPAESDYRYEIESCGGLEDYTGDFECSAGPAIFQVCFEPTGRARHRSG